jgi:diamine N-acetyltransferase
MRSDQVRVGPRVLLAPLAASDLPTLFVWINDRATVVLNAPYRPVAEPSHHAWFEEITARDDVAIFAIRLLETDRLIGTCQLNSIDRVHRSANLQIRIGDPADRGSGYGREAIHLLLSHGFEDLNLHRVALTVFADNEAALRAYEGCGFVREGLAREAAYIEGRYLDVVQMSVLRS